MSASSTPVQGTLDIRKYSNRRYYDATRSCHVTLEEIRNLIKQGHDIKVTDNESSADITSKVLAQIILDLDSPKFDLFPAGLLTQMIRVNDHFTKGFYEKFFRQAQQAFLDYQKLMEAQLKQGGMLPAMFPSFNAWSPSLMNPFGAMGAATDAKPAGSPPDAALIATLGDLQRQIAELQKQIKPSRSQKSAPPSRKRHR